MQKIKAEINYLIEEFGINVSKESIYLQKWIQPPTDFLDEISEQILAKVEPRLSLEVDIWLEEELKMKLLAPIFLLSEIEEPQKIGLFFERQITAEFETGKISVITDCMVSSVFGLALPQMPYFFMQEFKKSKGDKQDPEGQMLAAMIAAQHINKNGKTMYGSYVVGRDWFFSVLQDKDYAKSKSYQLTEPQELRQVILTLRKLKQIILNDLSD